MQTIKDGGPAFPLQSIGPDFAPGYAGMTLRDYFAAKAMQGIYQRVNDGGFERVAKLSYELADAMLAASEVKS